MLLFQTEDGSRIDENALYQQWQGQALPFHDWLQEQVLSGQLTILSGSHPYTFSRFLKDCREQEARNIRSRIRRQYREACLSGGASPREADAKAAAFVQSEEYTRLLEQQKTASRRLQSLTPDNPRLQKQYRDSCVRLLRGVAPQGLDAAAFLETLDMEKVFAQVYHQVVTRAVERLKQHLMSQKQFLSVRSGASFCRRELTAGLLPQFLKYYLSHWNERKLMDALNGMDLITFLEERSMRHLLLRRHEALNAYWLKSDKQQRDALLHAVVQKFLRDYPLPRILEGAAHSFTRESVLELLLHNPHYWHIALEYQEKQAEFARLDQQILSHMPQSFPELYPHARAMHRRFFLHIGPTNSGKTYQALEAFRNAPTGVYLAPLRLLAYEIFERTNLAGVPCDMMTGEEEIPVPEAKHISCTIEMLNTEEPYDVAVIDEAQMLSDEERGANWTAAILGVCAREIHVCGAENAKNILIQLIESCGDDYTIIEHERQVPLEAETEPFRFPESVQPEDALIVFSKSSVLRRAAQLQSLGIRTSVIYGALPYDVRQEEVRKFIRRETDVVVATDAIGMGLNLPIRRVVFLETEKFDGRKSRGLSGTEVRQIAGRAGRRGLYEVGYYNAEKDWPRIREKYSRPIKPIHHVYIQFPESLLSLDGKLSYLMEQWNSMEDGEVYRKGNITEQLELCSQLEEYSQDKALIYSFITIPFAENSRPVRQLWLDLFLLEKDGYSAEALLDSHLTEDVSSLTLAELELRYQFCDLLFHYCRRFLPQSRRRVSDKKAEISRAITEILSQ